MAGTPIGLLLTLTRETAAAVSTGGVLGQTNVTPPRSPVFPALALVASAGLVWCPFAPAPIDNTTNTVWPLTQGEKARPVARTAPQGYHLFVPEEAVLENTVTPDKWLIRWDRPPKYKPNLGFSKPFVPAEATVNNTVPGGWWQPLVGRAVPVPRAAPLGGAPFIPEEATVENTTVRVWPLTFGEKARPILRIAPQGVWAFGYPYEGVDNTRNEWDWYIPFPDRAPRFWWKGKPYQPFVPKEATVDNTTNTVWPLAQGEIARPIVRPRLGGQPFVPKDIVVDNTTTTVWPLTQGERARPIVRPALGMVPFVPATATVDNTTNTVWPLTQGAVARPIPRIAPQGSWVFGYPYEFAVNTRTEWDWYIQWPEKAPRFWWKGRPYQPFVAREAVLDNTVTPDKWQQRWQGPRRIRPRHSQPVYTTVEIAAPDNTVRPDKWLMRWRGPPRLRPIPTQPAWPAQQAAAVQYQQSIDATLTLTVDLHICGWGTETQEGEAFVVQAEQSDPWSEQTESDDDYDEQGECGT